ncbi:hypothetical protein [Streptomyces sp. NPDC088801]|uniref:hypothetical protein n=1 Tax=Streptomyces sp. NPDC088801 TaxID=3365903 RepID=UPI003809CCB8
MSTAEREYRAPCDGGGAHPRQGAPHDPPSAADPRLLSVAGRAVPHRRSRPDTDTGGDRLAEDVPSRNDLFTALAGPVGRAGPAVPRTRESALSRSLLEPFASSRS